MAKYICQDYKVKNDNDYIFSIDAHYGVIYATVCYAQDVFNMDDYIAMGFDLDICDTLEVICINQLLIDKEFAGKGYGSDLLKKIIDFCKTKFPSKQLYLCAEPLGHKRLDLEGLKEFYKKHGFITKINKKDCSYMLYKR